MNVEVVLLRHDPTEGFAYRRLITALGRELGPDRTARRVAALGEHDHLHMVHSTSWRATGDGGIVLTYLVHPDPDPERPGVPLGEPHLIARSSRPGHPAPPDLEVTHVVAHAVRHLAFLERTDRVVATHLTARPGLVRALRHLPTAVAGEVRYA
ncbi:hypothetical protein [Streptomyces anulatus]|uniref:hypothetical protein n=1 Tax=Streptomyces anulatus TaxID=1892 RepID=UPI003688842F